MDQLNVSTSDTLNEGLAYPIESKSIFINFQFLFGIKRYHRQLIPITDGC